MRPSRHKDTLVVLPEGFDGLGGGDGPLRLRGD